MAALAGAVKRYLAEYPEEAEARMAAGRAASAESDGPVDPEPVQAA